MAKVSHQDASFVAKTRRFVRRKGGRLIFAALLAVNSMVFASQADSNAPDPRMQVPAVFNHSWIDLSIGVKNTPFTANDLENNLQLRKVKDTIVALKLTLGHYFNPYIGVSASLMRGAHSNKLYLNMDATDYSVSESLFWIAAVPTLPLTQHFSVYTSLGFGYVAREGFTTENRSFVQNTVGVTNASIFSGVFGLGAFYRFSDNIRVSAQALYATGSTVHKQPGIFYAGLGFGYLLSRDHDKKPDHSDYNFPLNFLQLDWVNGNWFYFDVAKYTTTPRSIPVFFEGHIKLNSGVLALYERNFFHTNKMFSMEWGVSTGWWQSRDLRQSFYTISIFPELKFWFLRRPTFDMYFTYSLAGPTYISMRYIDNKDSGSHFTFQDFIGFGAFMGHSKRYNINIKLLHYSNGNTMMTNPGLCPPVMLGFGFAF